MGNLKGFPEGAPSGPCLCNATFRGNIEFAFGSSAPRLVEPRVDSASGYWGSRR